MVTVAAIVLGVLAFSALLGWIFTRATTVDGSRRDPRYRRRLLFINGAFCALGAVSCAVAVAMRLPPLQIFSSLLTEVAFILMLIRVLRETKAPPL